MHGDSRARRFLTTMARHLALWLLFALAAGPLFPGAAQAQFGYDGFAGPETEDAGRGAAGFVSTTATRRRSVPPMPTSGFTRRIFWRASRPSTDPSPMPSASILARRSALRWRRKDQLR